MTKVVFYFNQALRAYRLSGQGNNTSRKKPRYYFSPSQKRFGLGPNLEFMVKRLANCFAFFYLSLLLVGLLICSWAPVALAQDHSGHGRAQGEANQVATRVYETQGVLVEIDPANSRLVAQHQAIAKVGWEAMTMGFLVEDPSLLEGLEVGDQVLLEIRFGPEAGPQGYLVVGIEK
ncbi:MAG: copper-binding protein [Deltaproteobacteria bacterium]|jgi:Cu/Ag efflux protein CusF|nr:copper-binding protein [Deltaproteobacteria bacterium]